MKVTIEQAVTIEENGLVSYQELVAASGMTEDEVRDLVRYGALEPVDANAPQWIFRAEARTLVRRASGLRRAFELDTHALCVVLGFVERIDALEAQLRALRARGAASA
jgi:chaperone modulatory protein CbpM